MRAQRFALLSLAIALAGCPGGSSSQPDADADALDGPEAEDAPFEWFEVTPPEPPAVPWLDAGEPPVEPPDFLPCPTGWREAADPDSGLVTCDPWPASGPQDCAAADEVHLPGTTGCAHLGNACTDDPWAPDLPAAGTVLYVLAGSPAGGGGSRASPFGTIAEATASATTDTVIALGKGTYDEAVVVPEGVTLWGACVAETVVASSDADEDTATILADAAGAVVRNLRVEGERMGVHVTGADASLELHDVVIAGVVNRGIRVSDAARLTADGLVVRDMRSAPSTLEGGRGLVAESGAVVDVHRTALERTRELAVFATGSGTTLDMTDVAVRDTRSQESDRAWGDGLYVEDRAQVSIERTAFEHNTHLAMIFFHAGTVVTLRNVVVRDTQVRENDGLHGRALHVREGARAVIERGLFERNHEVGLFAIHDGTTLETSDVVVRDTMPLEAAPWLGRGMDVETGAHATVVRGVFERNHEFGIYVGDTGASVELTDVVVRDTRTIEGAFPFGRGLNVQEGASATVLRGLFEGNSEAATAVGLPGASLVMTDVAMRDTSCRPVDDEWGRGLIVESEAQATVHRALFERNREVAVFAAYPGAIVTLEDVVIRDTESRDSDGHFGRGLHVQNGAAATVRRAVFEGNREASISSLNDGVTVTLEDVVVRDTRERGCATGGCAEFPAGMGLLALGGGHIDADRFLVTGSAQCGIQVAHGADETGLRYPNGGTMDLHDGEVSFNAMCGANVQSDGFDLTRLADDVYYHDNPRDLDTQTLPVPDPHLDSSH